MEHNVNRVKLVRDDKTIYIMLRQDEAIAAMRKRSMKYGSGRAWSVVSSTPMTACQS